MKNEKELIELYGYILGDGHFRDNERKQMTFYNYDIKQTDQVRKNIEKITNKKIKIYNRDRKTGTEFTIYIPLKITKKLISLGYNKEEIPKWIFRSKHGIHFLKTLYECEGSQNGSQLMIYQSKREILDDCVKLANIFGISAHVHKSSIRRGRDFYLALDNVSEIKKLFGKTVKQIIPIIYGKGSYHFTKRNVLQILKSNIWIDTESIRLQLMKSDIHISKTSNVLINKHLNPLFKQGIILKKKSEIKRDSQGRFLKTNSKWKLKEDVSDNFIMNYPYTDI